MSRTTRATTALVVGTVMVGSLSAGCGTAEAAVRPVNVELVSYGGSDPPSGEYATLAVTCRDDLVAGRDTDCENLATTASASSDSQVAALAEALEAVSRANEGDYGPVLGLLPELPALVSRMNPSSRGPMTELVYRAAAIAYAARGDQKAADDAVRRAQKAAPAGRAREIAAERCRAAPTTPSCAGVDTSPPSTARTTPTAPPPTSEPSTSSSTGPPSTVQTRESTSGSTQSTRTTG
jgi:hypothetical protein